MDWMDLFDMTKLGKIAALTLVLVQYLKAMIPETYIKAIAMLIGIGVSVVIDLQLAPTYQNIVSIIVNGVIGAVLADTGYGFLSNKNGSFTLPTKED